MSRVLHEAETVRLGLVSARPIPAALIAHTRGFLEARLDGVDAREIPSDGFFAVSVTGRARPETVVDESWRAELISPGTAIDVDGALTTGELAESGPALIISDVDSTFLVDEVIELIARRAGSEEEVKAVTDRAMNGHLDFAESLRLRAATLEGVPESVFSEVLDDVRLTPGAENLVSMAHGHGATFGLVSGGFYEVLSPLARRVGVDRWLANTFEIEDGHLTARTVGPVIGREAKASALQEWAQELDIPLSRTVCVGDGANDLDMIGLAGLGVAFCAKPVVRAQAPAQVSFPRLDAVGALVGWPMPS